MRKLLMLAAMAAAVLAVNVSSAWATNVDFPNGDYNPDHWRAAIPQDAGTWDAENEAFVPTGPEFSAHTDEWQLGYDGVGVLDTCTLDFDVDGEWAGTETGGSIASFDFGGPGCDRTDRGPLDPSVVVQTCAYVGPTGEERQYWMRTDSNPLGGNYETFGELTGIVPSGFDGDWLLADQLSYDAAHLGASPLTQSGVFDFNGQVWSLQTSTYYTFPGCAWPELQA